MTPRAWTMILGLATLWGGSFFLVGVAIREWPPLSIVLVAGHVNLMLVTLLIPLPSFAPGAAFLGEALAPRHLIGLAGIAMDLAIIDGRSFMRRATPPDPATPPHRGSGPTDAG